MDKIFMPDVSPDERLQMLKDNCDSSSEETYYKSLEETDLIEKREDLTTKMIELDDLDKELLVAKGVHKLASDPLKKAIGTILYEIKTAKAEITGRLFNIADHKEGYMLTYDESGELVRSRKLRTEERQGRLFPIAKAQ